MDKRSHFIALFEKTLSLYHEKRFDQACTLIKEYQQSVQYHLVARYDRRTSNSGTVFIIIVSFGAKEGPLHCLDTLERKISNSEADAHV